MTRKSMLHLGRYDVTVHCDGLFEAKAGYIMHIDGEAARHAAVAGWGKPAIALDVNCFALQGPDGAILIDTGAGDAWGPSFGKARATLSAGGFPPDSIRQVLLTHIHGDHALGLLADGGAAFFPQAEILIPAVDLAFFTDPAMRETVPEARRGGFDVAAKVVQAYGSRIRAIPDGPVLPGIEAVPLPGHTPGHTGYRIEGETRDLMIVADALHIAELQLADPGLGLVFDLDPALSVATRRSVLDDAAAKGWVVAGGHLAGYGRVERHGDAFAMTAA